MSARTFPFQPPAATALRIRTAQRRVSGFTLFEMLVAVSLFALMSMLAYGGLDRVLAAREAVEQEAERWRELEAFFTRFQDDLDASLPRQTRNVFGIAQPAFQGNAVLVNEDDANLWLVRSVTDGPPRRIGYRLRQSRLEFLRWDELDPPPRSSPRVYTLMDKVKTFTLVYLDQNGLENTTWPKGQGMTERPRAIALELVLEDGLSMKRVFLLP